MNTVTSIFRPNRASSAAVLSAALFLGIGFSTASVTAQSVATVPVGAVTVTIAAGTGSAKNATVVSFPLINSNVTAGVSAGAVSALTATSITSTSAGWTASGLSSASAPFLVKFTSGAATGRTFIIAGNTSDTITIPTSDGVSSTAVSLTSLGVVAGDKFQIEDADTIFSIFGAGDTVGATGPLGSANPNQADTIQINTSNSYQTYYYDTAQGAWINFASEAVANNVVIRPDTAVIYNRLKNTPFNVVVTGSVPAVSRKAILRSGQVTLLSSYWPSNSTLGTLALQNTAGWVSSANPNVADLVQMRVGASWQTFYHDGTAWINFASEATSNSVVVPAASGLIINKRGLASAASELTSTLPYSL